MSMIYLAHLIHCRIPVHRFVNNYTNRVGCEWCSYFENDVLASVSIQKFLIHILSRILLIVIHAIHRIRNQFISHILQPQ